MFGLENYPEKNEEEQWQRFYEHIKEKYGRSGYIRLWIPNSPNAKKLEYIREILTQPTKLKIIFDKLYKDLFETATKNK